MLAMSDYDPVEMRKRLAAMDKTGTDVEAVVWVIRYGSSRDEWEIDTGHWHNAVEVLADERDEARVQLNRLHISCFNCGDPVTLTVDGANRIMSEGGNLLTYCSADCEGAMG